MKTKEQLLFDPEFIETLFQEGRTWYDMTKKVVNDVTHEKVTIAALSPDSLAEYATKAAKEKWIVDGEVKMMLDDLAGEKVVVYVKELKRFTAEPHPELPLRYECSKCGSGTGRCLAGIPICAGCSGETLII